MVESLNSTSAQRRGRKIVAGTVSALLLAGGLAVAAVAGANPAQLPQLKNLRVLPDPHVVIPASAHVVAPRTASQLTTYGSSVKDLGVQYNYTMVGTNPEVKGTSNTTTVTTDIMPLNFTVQTLSLHWNSTTKDTCDSGANPLTRVENSPLFVKRSWTFGKTNVGSSQYVGAYERADFWKYTAPTGKNPGYQLNLAAKVLPTAAVSVPFADARFALIGCDNRYELAVDPTWMENYVANTLVPLAQKDGANPTTFPLFVTHNVVLGNGSGCCILGYHTAQSTTEGVQTYGISDYDNSGLFGTTRTTASLSHEVGEWVNDPYGTNQTRPWGHIGQVPGCQSNLEVGDPLSGTVLPVVSGGFTYEVQELAFFSWFYRQSPSIGLHGWYSNNGTFKKTVGTC